MLAAAAPAAQTPQEPAPPAAEIEVESDARSDAEIARRLQSILQALGAFRNVAVAVSAGVVTLTGTVPDAASLQEAQRLAERVRGVAAVRNELTVDASLREQLAPAYERLATRLDRALALLPLLGVALLVFGAVLAGGIWAGSWHLWRRLAPNAFVAELIRQVVRIGFAVAGTVIALDIAGATALLGALLGTAGIVGLAVGFAVRDTIENYIASILLSIRQPFRPNDHVRIESHEGRVIRLTSRATVIMTLSGNHVRIPNATVFKAVIENFSSHSERRFEFVIGIDPEAPLRQAIAAGLQALRGLDFVLAKPEPVGLVRDLGDSNVLLWFSGWIDQRQTDHAKARGEALRLTKRALEGAGIAMSEPAYRLRLEGGTAPVPAPAGPPRPARKAEDTTAADASKETAIEAKVAEERARGTEQDLLDPAVRSE